MTRTEHPADDGDALAVEALPAEGFADAPGSRVWWCREVGPGLLLVIRKDLTECRLYQEKVFVVLPVPATPGRLRRLIAALGGSPVAPPARGLTPPAPAT